jgi:hypothetical protein
VEGRQLTLTDDGKGFHMRLHTNVYPMQKKEKKNELKKERQRHFPRHVTNI